MRLIDADALCEGRVSNDPVVIATKCAPSVDAEPVRRGVWIVEKRTKFNFETVNIKCSECNTYFYKKANYCPNCGAKMEGDGR